MRFRARWLCLVALAAACTSAGEVATTATSSDSTALGSSSTALGSSSTALGSDSTALGSDSTALGSDSTALGSSSTTDAAPVSEPVTVLAVADLTDCRGPDAEVAALVSSSEGVILMPGDLAYPDGSVEDFRDCFLPAYGPELDRIYAVPGDNEYRTPGAEGFFEVLSDRPGEPGRGWFAVELGAWQLIALNSNCEEVGGCGPGSDQYRWLEATLDERRYECRIVMWHLPRFTSSANYREIPRLGDLYARLEGAGADILIVGNSHHYERLGPLAPDGRPSDEGIMNFTVGVGGAAFTEFGEPRPGSQVRSNRHRGVLELTLRSDGYDWQFLDVESNPTPLDDRGSASC